MLSYTNYDAFSFNAWDPSTNPGEFGSLEDVHNEIHDRVGGGGHMSSLEVSSFDPFFWLHHVNVDRLWAIWQDLNPESFMTRRRAPYSTFSAEGGEFEDRTTPLAPFWDKSGTEFWTSDEIKNSALFGYAYPETQKWRYQSTEAYREALRQSVTALYGTNVFTEFVANVAERAPQGIAAAAPRMAIAAKGIVDTAKQKVVAAVAPKIAEGTPASEPEGSEGMTKRTP